MFIQAISRAAQIRGAELATICEGRTRTWAESKDRTARLASALRGLGVAAVFTPKDFDMTQVMNRIVDEIRRANQLDPA